MLSYTFDKKNNKPLYEQLYDFIRSDILNSSIAPDSRLPGKRPFAAHLGISVITVENAYARLNEEGYIRSVPRKGFFAENIQSLKPASLPQKTVSEKSPEKKPQTKEKKEKIFTDLNSDGMPPHLLPLKIWTKLSKEAGDYVSEHINTKIPAGGSHFLRTALCDHLRSFRGINASPEQIIVGAGSEYLYGLIVQLLGRNNTFALEDPGYKKIAHLYRLHGAEIVYIDSQSKKIKLGKELEGLNADAVHISPSHHFPTGNIMPASKRYELLSWASQGKDRYIIEDDYDAEFRFRGRPVPTLYGMDENGCTIYLNTFSKTISPTLRISYMILPQALCKTFYANLGFLSSTVSSLNQYVLARFLGEGGFEKHLNRARTYYRRIRDVLIKELMALPCANVMDVLEEGSGLHFLLRIKTDISDEEMIRRMRTHGINITVLSSYYSAPAPDTEHVFIVKYGGLDEAAIPETALRIGQAVV